MKPTDRQTRFLCSPSDLLGASGFLTYLFLLTDRDSIVAELFNPEGPIACGAGLQLSTVLPSRDARLLVIIVL